MCYNLCSFAVLDNLNFLFNIEDTTSRQLTAKFLHNIHVLEGSYLEYLSWTIVSVLKFGVILRYF